MKEITIEAKTVEEAIEKGLQEMGVPSRESVAIEVLEEGKSGLFGLGGKEARVKLTLKEGTSDKTAPAAEKPEEVLTRPESGDKGKEPGRQAPEISGDPEKLALETVQEITGMLDELKTRILILDGFSQREGEEMVLTAFRHWASVLRWVLWKSGKAFADEDARQALDLYTKSIYPVIGFNNFALLPAFQAFRDQARPDAIHKLKWMENSLSWRVTAPLRLSLDWLKQRLRKVGVA